VGKVDASAEIERIQRDKAELRHQLRLLLDPFAERHEIPRETVDAVMWDHATDLIEALFDDRSREMADEAGEAVRREDWLYQPWRRA
jgi:hypothetical protein